LPCMAVLFLHFLELWVASQTEKRKEVAD
jgi:hypothetical protein